MARARTLKNALQEIQEMRQKAAAYKASASYLRTRYLSRDSAKAQAQLTCDGAPVQEAVVEEVAAEMETVARRLEEESEAHLATEV